MKDSEFVSINEISKPSAKYLIEVDEQVERPNFDSAPTSTSQKIGLIPN